MNTRPWVPAFGLAGLLLAPALRAQDQPPPPPAPPVSPEDPGISLVYRYKTGQAQRFKLQMKGDFSLTPQGGASGLGPIPINMDQTLVYTEKVTGTREGTGTLSVSLDSMTITSGAMGMNHTLRMQNGKVTSSLNGKPTPAGASGMPAAAMQNMAPKKPVILKRDPTGASTLVGGAAPAMGTMMGGISGSIAQLPGKPVKVGETWESVQKVKPSLPGPAAQAGQIPEVEIRLTHTLKGLAEKNGKQFALIETTGNGSIPMASGTVQSMDQTVSGITRFDIARGAVVSGQYKLDLAMRMGLPPGLGAGAGGAAGGGAPQGMEANGTFNMTLMEAPVPAGAAKPAAKKAGRKKK